MSYHISGNGNAQNKRIRRGCEKDWNRYDEPFNKLLKPGYKTSQRWLQHKKQKQEPIEEI